MAKQKVVMNIPNILTVSRIVMIFIFVVLTAFGNPNIGCWVGEEANAFGGHLPTNVFLVRFVAFVLAVIAGFTDFLDGYLARKWNQVTDFGRLMDPLADKVFVTATMLMAVEYHLMPSWIVTAVLAREFMVTGLRTLAAGKGIVIAADRWGKIKTVAQMVMMAIAGLAWCGWIDLSRGKWEWFDFAHQPWTRVLWLAMLAILAVFTIYTGAMYFVRYRALYLNIREEKDQE